MTLRSRFLQALFFAMTAVSGAASADWRDVDEIINGNPFQSDQ
jgi:hypothetical protein